MSAIESFYGNSNKKPEVVDTSQLIYFNSCFEGARWKLDAAQLSSRRQVSVICQKLQGAILLAFMTQVDNAHEICYVTWLKSKLQGLFTESVVHYTDLAFHANSMVADIQTYHTHL